MNVIRFLAATVDDIAERFKKREIPQLHNDIYRKILEYLPIVDKIHLSLTCKRVYAVTELHLCYQAKELGFLSSTFPDKTEARDFFATLFKIVRILGRYRFLQESEIKRYDHRGFWINGVVMDTESTLRNIPKLSTERLIKLYDDLDKYLVSSGENSSMAICNPCLHLFILRHLPKQSNEEIRLQSIIVNQAVRFAAINGCLDIIDFFINHGADLNHHSRGRTPLLCALHERKNNVVNYLLENGADPNICESDRDAPIHKSVWHGDIDMIKTLLLKGVNINTRGHNGYTPLRIAQWTNNIAMMTFLIEKGADPNIRDNEGETNLKYAEREQRTFIAELLRNAGAK